MSEETVTPPNGRVTTADVYAAVDRTETRLTARLEAIEGKLDSRLKDTETKVDQVASRLDRLEGTLGGSLGMVKWLGPAGVAALVIGLARGLGIL